MLASSFSFVFLTFASLIGFSLAARGGGALARSLPSAAVDLGTGTSAGEVEFATIVQGWSAVPWAFSKCRSTFEQKPPAKMAIQAISTLESSIKIVVAQHGTCKLCRSLGTQSTYYVEFEQIIRQIFVSWQSVLIDGAQKYVQEWKTTVGVGFKTFASFLTTVYNMCISLQINLSVIFRSIHLNYQLFSEVGLNLVQILKLNVGVITNAQPHVNIQGGTLSGNRAQPIPSRPANTIAPGVANTTPSRASAQSSTPNKTLSSPNLTTINVTPPRTLVINNSSLSGLRPSQINNVAWTPSGRQALAAIVQAWSTLPIAFAKSKTVFEQKPSASIALQAVATLHGTVQSAIARYGTCKSCAGLSIQDTFHVEFQRILREIFSVWQSLLIIGEQQYVTQWSTSFRAEFAKFDQLLAVVYGISSSIKLDLRGLLDGIPLKTELFLRAGLDLSSRLNIPRPSGLNGGKSPAAPTPSAPISGPVAPYVKGATNRTLAGTVVPNGTANRAAVATGSSEKGLLLVVQSWSTLPKAFLVCQSAFERGVSINVAVQAVVTLHGTVQSALSRYGTCATCTGLAAGSPVLIEFRDLVAQILASWQSVLEVGQKTYRLQWHSSIGLEFQKFSTLWAVIKTTSASVRLNLDALLNTIHLRTSVFADIGIDLGFQFTHPTPRVGSDPQALQASTAKIPVHGISAVVYGWAALPSAFSTCQSTLESHASINVALQAIATLHATLQATISTYGSCNSCITPYPQSPLAVRFRGIISQIFISWQQIIHVGRANYGTEWNTLAGGFKEFSSFLWSVKNICGTLKINLGTLFGELRINTDVFADVGLNLHAHLNLNFGAQIGKGSCSGNFLGAGFRNCVLDGFRHV